MIFLRIFEMNKTEKVQSKTARQVCDRKTLFEYIIKFPKAFWNKFGLNKFFE